jgi:hypothetical protein
LADGIRVSNAVRWQIEESHRAYQRLICSGIANVVPLVRKEIIWLVANMLGYHLKFKPRNLINLYNKLEMIYLQIF